MGSGFLDLEQLQNVAAIPMMQRYEKDVPDLLKLLGVRGLTLKHKIFVGLLMFFLSPKT